VAASLAAADVPAKPANDAVNVLLVDDQPSRLVTYEAILSPLGHRLVTANSGVEALERLMNGEFAVILLDVSMPGMDGFETAQMIHNHPRFEGTPIIFVTGVHVSELDRLKGYELGAVDYVYVPVVPQILRSKVQVLVELYRQRVELKRLNESLQHEKASELAVLNRSLEESNRELAAANDALTQEVAERTRAEQALRDADRRKDDFLAILAHELRNPLAPIRNAIEILQRRGGDDPMLVRMRDLIERQVQHLSRLVDDLLDVSRITQGKINLKPQPVDLREVVKHAIESNMAGLRTHGHALKVTLPADPVHAYGDPVRLTQVIGNLINNAVKYTPEAGHIEVGLSMADGSAAIAVRDDGIGIPAEYLSHVFELFGQVRNPRPHGQDGLGIGLALVQRLIGLHDGVVEARSEGANCGSEFVVKLPLLGSREVAAIASAAAPADRASLAGHRILVVDDHMDSRDSLAAFLEMAGNLVLTAADGMTALEAAASFEPQIVLLDIRMPVMDGYETAKRLRATPAGQAAILVALTGWGQEEHRERSRVAGFDAHLTKPLDFDVLARLVESLSAGRRPVAVPAG
jgi:signal transduction histidine kinase